MQVQSMKRPWQGSSKASETLWWWRPHIFSRGQIYKSQVDEVPRSELSTLPLTFF
ncbi:hypothetical protein FQN60_001649 [Etheostoma spectabile]|uniref:Uncharacterized protein n=1 Tax=Etheostoma spectabile TaxID=54343 RepID=A0A5J5D788_9PERO|nr:hypothetical protein FQN60_001649 [Etheostoma spectabile]